MYLSQMPDKYDTCTEPTSANYQTDVTLNLRVKVEKIKGGRFYAELLKLSNKLYKNRLQKMCRFVFHHFQS